MVTILLKFSFINRPFCDRRQCLYTSSFVTVSNPKPNSYEMENWLSCSLASQQLSFGAIKRYGKLPSFCLNTLNLNRLQIPAYFAVDSIVNC